MATLLDEAITAAERYRQMERALAVSAQTFIDQTRTGPAERHVVRVGKQQVLRCATHAEADGIARELSSAIGQFLRVKEGELQRIMAAVATRPRAA